MWSHSDWTLLLPQQQFRLHGCASVMQPWDMSISGQKFSRMTDWVGRPISWSPFFPAINPLNFSPKVNGIRVATLKELYMVIYRCSCFCNTPDAGELFGRKQFTPLTVCGLQVVLVWKHFEWFFFSNTANCFVVSTVLYVSCMFII
jgi:hypothetical protein